MEKVKNLKTFERILLDRESSEKIQTWMKQIEKELGDTVNVTQKSLVNLIFQYYPVELSADIIEKIRTENYDIIKALKKATDEAIKAKKTGARMQLSEALKIIQTPGVNSEVTSKKALGRKRKEIAHPPTLDKIQLNSEISSTLSFSKNDPSKIQNLDTKTSINEDSSPPDFSLKR